LVQQGSRIVSLTAARHARGTQSNTEDVAYVNFVTDQMYSVTLLYIGLEACAFRKSQPV